MNRKYPWEKWFRWLERAKRRVLVLTPGIDFECMPHSMSVLVRNQAIMRGRRAGVNILKDGSLRVILKED